MLNGVARGQLDAGISAITMTEDRQKVYDFMTLRIHTLKVQQAFGTTYPGLKRYDVISSAVEDLKLGRVDAVVVDEAVNAEYLKKLGENEYKMITDPTMPAIME